MYSCFVIASTDISITIHCEKKTQQNNNNLIEIRENEFEKMCFIRFETEQKMVCFFCVRSVLGLFSTSEHLNKNSEISLRRPRDPREPCARCAYVKCVCVHDICT